MWFSSISKTSADYLANLTEEDFRDGIARTKRRYKIRNNNAIKKTLSRPHARKFVRKRKRHIKKINAKPKISSRSLIQKNNLFLDSFFPARNNPKTWKKKNRRPKNIPIDKFCFIDSPTETLQNLVAIAKAEALNRSVSIDFNMEQCTDVSPLLIFGLMRKSMNPVFRGGRIYGKVRKVLNAVKMAEFLHMELGNVKDQTDVWPFSVRTKSNTQSVNSQQLTPQRKEKVSRDLVHSIQEWLEEATNDNGKCQQLTEEALSEIEAIITELLDNAERHANPSSRYISGWTIAGFMARRNTECGEKYVCHIGIVSENSTIASSMANSTDITTQQVCEAYKLKHPKLTAEIRNSVMALQPGTTRIKTNNAKGGVGLPKTIGFLNKLAGTDNGNTAPKLTILSGNVCMKVHFPYNNLKSNNGSGHKYLFFNEDNSFAKPPDSDYVYETDVYMPGTVIAMRFNLDPVISNDE